MASPIEPPAEPHLEIELSDAPPRIRGVAFVALVGALFAVLVTVVALGGEDSITVRSDSRGTSVIESSSVSTAPTGPASTAPAPTTTAPITVPPPRRVAFFGDSLAVETDPHLAGLLRHAGIEYRFEGYGGTATCDYLDEMQQTATEFQPDVVVLLFTGNALTPCMTSRTGGAHGILTDQQTMDLLAYTAAYDIDTASAIDAFGPDVRVILVGPPQTRPGRSAPALVIDDLYRDYATARANVEYLSDVELLTPGGVYADVLPCTFVEPCTVGDPVRVRAEDGGHLCPEDGFCYGGLRLAISIADVITAGVNTA